ncbi:MAG: hypothetical protein GTN76_09190 [Candidatus Aenigmarchaeota archaeon]|nr:hypothetical protein [Candidatus Aenigmarchaeota archaeon]
MADVLNNYKVDIMQVNHLSMTNEEEINLTKKMLGVDPDAEWPDSEGFITEEHGIDSRIVIRELKKLTSKAGFVVRHNPYLTDEQIEKYYSDETFRLRAQCFTPWFKVQIKANGDVTPCFDFKIGNIRDESFDEIWYGRRMTEFRTAIQKYGNFPFCDRKCCDSHFKEYKEK